VEGVWKEGRRQAAETATAAAECDAVDSCLQAHSLCLCLSLKHPDPAVHVAVPCDLPALSLLMHMIVLLRYHITLSSKCTVCVPLVYRRRPV
jgi:hypothetical protein